MGVPKGEEGGDGRLHALLSICPNGQRGDSTSRHKRTFYHQTCLLSRNFFNKVLFSLMRHYELVESSSSSFSLPIRDKACRQKRGKSRGGAFPLFPLLHHRTADGGGGGGGGGRRGGGGGEDRALIVPPKGKESVARRRFPICLFFPLPPPCVYPVCLLRSTTPCRGRRGN